MYTDGFCKVIFYYKLIMMDLKFDKKKMSKIDWLLLGYKHRPTHYSTLFICLKVFRFI